MWPYFLWDDRKGILPNLSYNLFEKSGHFPMVEERELFDKRLVEWIRTH
jgi:pimeloyl-ACP methyl ester carboxylesterase